MNETALIIVDVQNDFCDNGSLPVPNAEQIIPGINKIIEYFHSSFLPVYATRDWLPIDHCSFKSNGGLWPMHCVQQTKGSQIHPELLIDNRVTIIDKGADKDKEAYSGFDGTDFSQELRKKNISKVIITGLATDYCINWTTIGALNNGFSATVISDLIRGIDLKPGDCKNAINEMSKSGAKFINSFELN